MIYPITEKSAWRDGKQDRFIERVVKIFSKWHGQEEFLATAGDESAIDGEEAEDFTI